MRNHATRSKTTKVADVHKACVNTIVAVFDMFTTHKHEPAQLRALTKALLIVGQKARNSWHIMQLIAVLFDEAEEDKIPLSKWGTYLLKRVKNKPLPKVDKSLSPFVGAESLSSVPQSLTVPDAQNCRMTARN